MVNKSIDAKVAHNDHGSHWDRTCPACNESIDYEPAPAEAEPVGGKTWRPPGMLQDYCKGLSKWLSNTPNARQEARLASKLPPRPTAQAESTVKWCKGCGEGVTYFCRGSLVNCPMKFVKHLPSKPKVKP